MIEDLTKLWDDLFDQIYVINLESNGRQKECEDELRRVGILQTGKVHFFYTYNTPLKQALLQELMPKFWMQNRPNVPYAFDCSFGHYTCWCRSKVLNHKRILMLEDDISFLKDINEIEKALKCIPADADIVLFDKLFIDFCKYNAGDETYIKYDSRVTQNWSGVCYSLDSKAIDFLCKKQEEKLQPADEIMVRYYDESDLNRYFISKSLCTQSYKYNVDKWKSLYIPWFKLNPEDYKIA